MQRYTSDGGTHHHIDDEIRKLEQQRSSLFSLLSFASDFSLFSSRFSHFSPLSMHSLSPESLPYSLLLALSGFAGCALLDVREPLIFDIILNPVRGGVGARVELVTLDGNR